MPRVHGTPPCIGALGNTIFYQMNGKYFAKRKGYIPYERIMTDFRYARHRENMAEMGFGAHVSSRIKRAWNQCQSHAKGSYIQSQLNAEFVEIVRAGEGIRGERSVQLTRNGHLLEGFQYEKGRNPDDHFSHLPTVTTEETASGLRVILRFDPKTRHNHRRAAAKDTHFTLFVNAVVISDHHATPNTSGKMHALPLEPKAGLYFGSKESQYLPIGTGNRSLPAMELEFEAPHHAEQAIIISYGLKYYHEEKGQMVSTDRAKPRSRLKQRNAYMRVLKVQARRAETEHGAVENRDSVPHAEIVPVKTTAPNRPIMLAADPASPAQSAARHPTGTPDPIRPH